MNNRLTFQSGRWGGRRRRLVDVGYAFAVFLTLWCTLCPCLCSSFTLQVHLNKEQYSCGSLKRTHALRYRFCTRELSRRKHFKLCSIDPEAVIAGDEVFSLHDLTDGTILAFVLAFSYSYLQRDSSSIILWRRNEDSKSDLRDRIEMKSTTGGSSNIGNTDDRCSQEEVDELTMCADSSTGSVFDEKSWTEMSRPENYIFFTKREGRRETTDDCNSPGIYQKESKAILIGLLLLFVPLFSVEFFFALSRQFICGGDPFSQSDLANYLCSAHQ
mmetsp:Transcript_24061/g.37107  ORF Transcript_24061/g.37107 Transcript_24061/m.37107 type:complete len:272 (-) Transcript_24061:102-917(-)